MRRSSQYRADIDGMRAIAVLSVIAFHIHEPAMPGGFVGVDVFFVISGFLITRSIVSDIDEERFSLVRFYERRVKRIIPAMALIVLITTVAAQALMLPDDAISEAKSAIWSLFSAANIYFWLFQDTSYFAPDSAHAPLLHLWSLGVEEQFYLLYPLLLRAAYARTRRLGPLIWGMVAIALASFLGGQLVLKEHASFAYYNLVTRAGELLLGALVSIELLRHDRQSQSIGRKLAGYLGCGLLAASLVLLSEQSGFPGYNAALPTLGTALLIWSGSAGPTLLTRLLSLKPLRWIGLISYSAYLWHWPLLAFYRYGYGEVTLVSGAVIFVATIALSWLSYRYVEQPGRHTKRPTKAVFVRQLVWPVAGIAVLAVTTLATRGFGYRLFVGSFEPRYSAMAQDDEPPVKYSEVCQRRVLEGEILTASKCEVGPGSAKPARAILWGDSNAAHYVNVLKVFAQEGNFRFFNLEHSACPPMLVDPKAFTAPRRLDDCHRSLAAVRPRLREFDVVIIGATWTEYAWTSNRFYPAFETTIETLLAQGKEIILLGKVPVFRGYDRLCGKKALIYPSLECGSRRWRLPSRVRKINAYLKRQAAKSPKVHYYDINDTLCRDGTCSPYDASNYPLFYDKSHLGNRGARRIARSIVESKGLPAPFQLLADREAGQFEHDGSRR